MPPSGRRNRLSTNMGEVQAVESHHWVMDMVFRDDECRIRNANAPANFATIKHIAQNLLRRAGGKNSLRVKRRLAAWNDSYLKSLVEAG